ncbi:hypothetical protein TRAPUB_9942 [Trametes pubescens]|uniref:Uncharacterized protein n=1 Tax=Trametes pubescens TaxID=154538 RepID=A0A1M2W164_TRAPU|nr:hypothetical protein TRAPUB_9942 [Trametes pubescens]
MTYCGVSSGASTVTPKGHSDADIAQGSQDHSRITSIAVDTGRSEPVPLESPDEYELWAATSKRLAGLSLEDECKRVSELTSQARKELTNVQIIAILENGYPSKTTSEGVADVASERIKLPHVPFHWEFVKERRPHFFGWPVTSEWIDLFARCARPYCKDGRRTGLTLLKELCGADGHSLDLTQELAVHEDVPLQLDDDDDEVPPKELRFEMVSIRNTLNADGYLVARLTRAQYEWLKLILPGEAQWYKSVYTRQSLYEMTM